MDRTLSALPVSKELVCGLCSMTWKEEAGVVCGTCREVYHQHCFRANAGCVSGACRNARRDGRSAGRDLTVMGIGRENCRVCGKSCEAFHGLDCPSCARPYHVYCWIPNGGCLKDFCRAEAGRPLLPPSPSRSAGRGLAATILAWRRWTAAIGEAFLTAAGVLADELTRSLGLRRRGGVG